MKNSYLGDGAYAEQDDGDPMTIWLWCDRPGGRHAIALEPDAYLNLQRFVKDVWPNLESK